MSQNTTSEIPAGLRAALEASSLRLTGQRLAVWEVFAATQGAFTPGQVVDRLRSGDLRGVGQATVYRAIKLLHAAGLLKRLDSGSGEARYAACTPGHHHLLTCRSCGRAVEFSDCDLSVLEKLVSVKTGFLITGHRLELFGYCPSCRIS